MSSGKVDRAVSLSDPARRRAKNGLDWNKKQMDIVVVQNIAYLKTEVGVDGVTKKHGNR